MRVGIIGLGLIGGSLGLNLRDMKLIERVLGYDASEENLRDALRLGLIDEAASFAQIKGCDMIFLAVPVEAVVAMLPRLRDVGAGTTIVDLGSTKREILRHCPDEIRANFIAAHPMAGTENSGPKAAFKSLLNGAVVVICDDKNAAEMHIKRAVETLSHAGMKIVFMDAASHDHHVGLISHLPHAISFALVNATLKEEDKRNILLLAGGSFTGMSRIAKSNTRMWSDIFKQNRDNLLDAMGKFEAQFRECERLVREERWEELDLWIENARTLREIL